MTSKMRSSYRLIYNLLLLILLILVINEDKVVNHPFTNNIKATALDDAEPFRFKNNIRIGINRKSLLQLELSTVDQRDL
jgi:hypothetical protein